MDKHQHQELESVQNRDRSRRSRSKLSSALEYGELQQPLEAAVEQSPERALSPRRIDADIPSLVVTDIGLLSPVVPDIPSPVVADIPSPVVPGILSPVVPDIPPPIVADISSPVVPGILSPVVPEIPPPIVDDIPSPVVPDIPPPIVDDIDILSPVVPDIPSPVVADIGLLSPVVPDIPSPIVDDILSPVVADVPSPVVPDILSPVIADIMSTVGTSDTLSPGRAASAHSIDKSDPKKNMLRNSSKSSSQVYDLPKPHSLDRTSGIGSTLTLSSPEPSLFAAANRISQLSFKTTPLPPIRSSRDKEAKQREVDTDKSRKMLAVETSDEPETWEEQGNKLQDYRKKKEEERQKAVMENQGLQVELCPFPVLKPKLSFGEAENVDTCLKLNSVTESHSNYIHTQQKQHEVPLPALRVPHPPSRPKIAVRETKASRLRKNKLQMQCEKLKVLPPIKAPVKLPTRAAITVPVSISRSSSESPPPTPIALEPSRPACVPKLDLSGLLSPENISVANNIPLAPRDIIIRETKASKLLRLKKLEDQKLAKRRAEEEQSKNMTFGQPMGEKTFLGKRSPTQLFKPAPQQPFKKPEPVVVIKETKSSKLRKLRELKEERNKGPLKKNKKEEGSQSPQQQFNTMDKSTSDAKEIDPSFLRNNQDTEKIKSAHRLLKNGPENPAKNGPVATLANVEEVKEHTEDKEQEGIDKSARNARNNVSRKETAQALKVEKAVRLAMEENEKRWQSQLVRECRDIEGPFLFGNPDSNREIITQALDSLKEQLEEAEAADKSESKVKAFGSNLQSKENAEKDGKEIENMRKEIEEKIDGYFRGTVRSLNSVLGDIWERFIYQQDSYRELLEKVTVQEEMLNKWKSEARHYRFMHTMLKQDYLREHKDSWYL